MLQREQQIGAFAQFLAQQCVLRLEEQDVADVDQRVIGDADRLDVVAPFLDERPLFRKIVLPERRAAVAVAVSALLHEFEIADVRQTAVPEQAVAGHRREHPHRPGVGVFHGVFLRADDAAQIGLCADFNSFAAFRAPERERVVADIAVDRFEPVGERETGNAAGRVPLSAVDVVNGVFENFVPVGAAPACNETQNGFGRLLRAMNPPRRAPGARPWGRAVRRVSCAKVPCSSILSACAGRPRRVSGRNPARE